MDHTALVLAALLASCVINAIADVFLLWGARYTNYEPGLPALQKTPEKYLLFGSLIGLVILPVWFLICFYLTEISGPAGLMAFLVFAAYVAAVLCFHVCYAFVGLGIQRDAFLEEKFEPVVKTVAGFSFLLAILFTGTMIFIGATDRVAMTWLHYATLPLFTIIFFQMILGRLLRFIPYFQAFSGTLAMAAFFYGFMDMVAANPGIFAVGS